MAVAVVQHKAGTFTTQTSNLTFDSSTTSGNLIAVLVMSRAGTPTEHYTVTDNKSNTSVENQSIAYVNACVEAHTFKNITGGASHQVSVDLGAAPAQASWVIVELSGADTTTPVGNSSEESGDGAAIHSGTATPTADGLFLAAGHMDTTAASPVIEAGWTELVQASPGAIDNLSVVTKSATASSADEADWTCSFCNYTGVILAISNAAAGGTNPKGPLSNPLAGPFGGPI